MVTIVILIVTLGVHEVLDRLRVEPGERIVPPTAK
jgi:hypothetical protein